MRFRISKKSFLVLPIALISIELYLGIILGYFSGKFLAGKYDGYQRVKSIFVKIGNYKLHLHHWLVSLIILIVTAFYNLLPFLPYFFYGILGGLIIQDLYLDSDWSKILIKET